MLPKIRIFKFEESEEICEISEGDDEYDEDFLQYIDIDKKKKPPNFDRDI